MSISGASFFGVCFWANDRRGKIDRVKKSEPNNKKVFIDSPGICIYANWKEFRNRYCSVIDCSYNGKIG
jgi:hypothetical protein